MFVKNLTDSVLRFNKDGKSLILKPGVNLIQEAIWDPAELRKVYNAGTLAFYTEETATEETPTGLTKETTIVEVEVPEEVEAPAEPVVEEVAEEVETPAEAPVETEEIVEAPVEEAKPAKAQGKRTGKKNK